MPVATEGERSFHLANYPAQLTRPLKLTLMSLDITEYHMLSRGLFTSHASSLTEQGSPLAQWMTAFMTPMLDKMERLHVGHEGEGAALALHDPLCIWYVLTGRCAMETQQPQPGRHPHRDSRPVDAGHDGRR